MASFQHAEAASEEDPLLAGPNVLPQRITVLLMTSFTFPMSVIWSTMGMIVLPAEALWYFPGDESMCLGFFLFITGVSQLVCPIAGIMSDRCRCRWGKRRPFICIGTAVALVGIAGMWLSSIRRLPCLFFVALFFSQTGLNITYSAQASIVPDFYRVQMGEVSGMVSILQLSGQLFGMFYVMSFADYDFHYIYCVYLIMLSVAAIVVCSTAQERSSLDEPSRPMTLEAIKSSFWIDLGGERDFFWVFVGRTLFYMATALQTFMYYYLRDLMELREEAQIRMKLAILALVATLLGLSSSYPLGTISDRVGRKPLIYYACCSMAMSYAGYTVCPLFGPRYGMYMTYILGGLYGLGLGGYLSVDYALAIDCLPEKQKGSSEALGLWGISGFIGSALGPIFGGFALEALGGWGATGHYSYSGYVVLLLLGVFCLVLCGMFTSFIKKECEPMCKSGV
mmetsp:Transcript_88122/g.247853  ORF Transcript_88122/g.247853 Transcript_88122/m.247853 type:complete len:452 (-) Transcript_88122:35-1390(-)